MGPTSRCCYFPACPVMAALRGCWSRPACFRWWRRRSNWGCFHHISVGIFTLPCSDLATAALHRVPLENWSFHLPSLAVPVIGSMAVPPSIPRSSSCLSPVDAPLSAVPSESLSGSSVPSVAVALRMTLPSPTASIDAAPTPQTTHGCPLQLRYF